MKYTNLGKAGVKVSRVCLGCMSYGLRERKWGLDEEQSKPFIKRALELGINFFDTANMYGDGASEEVLGRALHDFAKRDEVVVATKVYFPMRSDVNGGGLSRKAIMTEIDNSLRRLAMDYVDLYQIHRFDYETPIEETLKALHDVVKSGKARYLGASSMYTWQFARMLTTADRLGFTRFVTMQNHYNLIYREEEREMIPLCRAEGVGLIPWSPLARGLLGGRQTETVRAKTDDYAKRLYGGAAESDERVIQVVQKLAAERGVTPAQIALAWLYHKGITAPIIGVSKPHHLADA